MDTVAEIRPDPIGGAAVWRAADFPDLEACTERLTAAQIADIEAACERVEGRGAGYEQSTLADFPLPTWSATFARLREQLDRGRGFVLVSRLPVERWSDERARLASWGIGLHVGNHVSQTIAGALICDVTDVTKGEATPRQYRTNRELSLHTDPVSDLIGLVCLRPAKSGGGSVLASSANVYNTMLAQRPDLLALLMEGFHVHRFGEERPEDGPVTRYRVPMFVRSGDTVSCRYVRPTVIAGHKDIGIPLTDAQLEALDLFDRIAGAADNHVAFTLAAGDFVLINNLAVLHARTQFADYDEPERARHLLRLWLEAPAGFRDLPPELNYYNGGRCGIPVRA